MRERGHRREGVHSYSWAMVLIALGMIAYVMLVGRYLGSSFFLSAMCWGWMAMCGLRGRLEEARDMAIVMSFLSLLAVLVVLVAGDAEGRSELLTLGLVPSLVIWTCVALYIRDLRSR